MEGIVPFEISKKLQEKGFKEKCFAYYDVDENSEYWIDAPTIPQVFKWLREEKKIFITINIAYCYEDDEHPFPTNPEMKPILKGYYYGVWNLDNLNDKNGRSEYFESPEQAALAGIEYVIDNIL